MGIGRPDALTEGDTGHWWAGRRANRDQAGAGRVPLREAIVRRESFPPSVRCVAGQPRTP